MTNIEKFKKKLAYIIYTKSPENLVLLRKILKENIDKGASPVGGFDYYFVQEPNGNVYHSCDKADFSKHLIYNLEGIRIEDFYEDNLTLLKNGQIILKYNPSEKNIILLNEIMIKCFKQETLFFGSSIYYYADKGNSNKYSCNNNLPIYCNYPVVNIEDFYKNKTINMKKQSLKRSQLKGLMNISDCYDWFQSINEILKSNVVDDEIEIEQKFIDLLIEEGNVKQRDAVKKLGIVLEKDTTLDTLRGSSKHFDSDDKYNGSNMICVRKNNEFKDKAYLLHPNFEWEIVEDTVGCKCLIPKK